MTRSSRTQLENHVRHWIDAWNAHDVEAVVSAFSVDAVFTSPLAAQVTGHGRISGIDDLRRYWTEALGCAPDLRFDLDSFAIDEARQTGTVFYVSLAGGRVRRASEHMVFRDGKQVLGEAYYGAEG
jgi:ketosteroid isomerase-like protein